MLLGGCGRAPDSYHTGTRCSRVIARRAAARSAASSSSVEEMNTRTRWSGVKITSVSVITSQASPRHHEDHLRRRSAGAAPLDPPARPAKPRQLAAAAPPADVAGWRDWTGTLISERP